MYWHIHPMIVNSGTMTGLKSGIKPGRQFLSTQELILNGGRLAVSQPILYRPILGVINAVNKHRLLLGTAFYIVTST